MRRSVWLFLMMCVSLFAVGQTVTFDFEDGSLDGWTQFPENMWETSSSNPLNGSLSLKHAPTSGAATDRISFQIPEWDEDQGTITWRFKLKHGWNPSATNYWAVFISSDQNAEGMISSANPNGYLVGVNLTGSDDILKLYRVDNGTYTSIINSTVNWQTDITTSGIGAIEIERKNDGTFTFKVSTSGSYLNLQNQGSVVDATYSLGAHFGVYYLYTTSAAGLLTVDDISLSYKQINPNDHDALVLEPAQQVEGSTISSLETNPEEGADVLSFVIQDQGTSDNLPTYTTNLRFNKVDSPQAANFPETIGGVILRSNSDEIPIISTSITDNSIELLVDKEAMVVEDNSSREFTLAIYLKPESIFDGATVQLKVEDIEHGWETDIAGSEFVEVFPASILSNPFTIQVAPTHLSFYSYPSQVIVNEPFNIVAHATDVVGNLATTYNSAGVELSLGEGVGEILPLESLTTNAVNGVATWSNVAYSERDEFSLIAFASGLSSVEGEMITVINDPTSIVGLPTNQPEEGTISSKVTTPGQAVEVFRFSIVDDGQNDEVPTHVRQLFIKRASGSNMASFSGSIEGVVVKANDQIVSTGNPHILTASISIPIPQNGLVVPDGETVEVSIYVYLRTSSLADGANLRFMVDSESHNFIADAIGSTFTNSFPEQILSNNYTIDVEATQLSFSSVPSNVGLESSFYVEVSAVDAGGSLDINAVDTVVLSKNSGDGLLSILTPQVKLTSGKALWNSLSYNIAQPFTLLASSPLLNDVISPIIYCSDITSTILQADVPLNDGVISTLAVDQDEVVEVFRFRVYDPGTTDGLPTYITQMGFKSFGLPNEVPLNKAIGGVVIWIEGEPLIPTSIATTASEITLIFDLGSIIVPDGMLMDFSLGIYLKNGGQIDNSAINLHIPAAGHDWKASPLGSVFPTTIDATLMGPVFTIEAVATSLTFVDQPFIASPLEPITLNVAATDLYGNIDFDATGDAEFSIDFGPGSFTIPTMTAPFQSGIAIWDELVLESIGKYSFKASSFFEDQAEAYSQPIWNGDNIICVVNEDFNDGYPVSFPSASDWAVSTVSPISGAQSLKHALSEVGGESELPIPLSVSNLGDSPFEWSFMMRNGNWDPTSDNTFWFVLASDSSSIKLGDFNGYAVGVNLSGSSDLLTLWSVSKGSSSQIVVQSAFNWDESETIGVKVTRSPNGEWGLWYQPNIEQSAFVFAGKSNDSRYTEALYFGPVFKYTSTRAGELWIDNLKVCGATFPPVIQSAKMRNLTTVDILFSAAIDLADAVMVSNYDIMDSEGQFYSVIEAYPNPENPLRISLRTNQLPLSELLLTVEGIRSEDGNTMVNDSINIGLGSAGTFGNIIINEIMSRPSPVVGLPDVEYIELYNRTSSTINLNGWRILGSTKYANLPEVSIEPNGYLILSGTSGSDAMSEYGNALGVTSFPTLLVGGMFLALYDDDNNLISWVEYSDTWYQDDVKKTGGVSLERIDPNNLVEGKHNWIGSDDISGGTPGRENSVNEINPDEINPRVVELKVIDATRIEIGYSEPMDSLSITLITNYTVSNGVGSPIWAKSYGPKYNRVELIFANPFVIGEIYDICFDESIIDFSGNVIETNCLSLALPERAIFGDIIINEVLFNPYTGGVDFVEIFNRSEKPIDLSKVWIANRDRTSLGLNEFYPASDSAWLLLPRNYAVLTENPKLVEQFYYVEKHDAMVWTREMPAYSSDNGYVLILGEFGEVIDDLAYNENMHNKLISDVKGVSLERINPEMPTNDPSSWQSAAQTSGFATPAAKNSQFTEPVKGDDAFNLSSQVFSPDGDGFEDVLLISYELPESGFVANIMVFDSRGRRVKRLAANTILGTSGSIKWDGTTDANGRASMGAYIVFIEAFDLKGNLKRYKKTVVVATKLRN